jgi:hypothetical protein
LKAILPLELILPGLTAKTTRDNAGNPRNSHPLRYFVEQQIQDDAGEITFLWTETKQPAVLK